MNKNALGEGPGELIAGIVVLAVIILTFVIYLTGDPSEPVRNRTLSAEMSVQGDDIVEIINRDSFDWTNVSVTLNEYYSCLDNFLLARGEDLRVVKYNCKDLEGRTMLQPINSVFVKADQGTSEQGIMAVVYG